LGWPKDKKQFKKFWPGVQVAGKDNLRQQSAMWQAMLMSAGLPNSNHVLIFGFINSGGQKMSKSLGNVINPLDLVQKYGTDATRYFLVAGLTAYEDSDFTYERFEEKYNSALANEFGNLVSRVLAMTEKYYDGIVPKYNVSAIGGSASGGDSDKFFQFDLKTDWEQYDFFMKNFKLEEALNVAWDDIRRCNAYIDKNRPWELAANNDDETLPDVIFNLLETIRHIAWMILPFMPQASEKILVQLGFDFAKESEKGIEALRQWGGLKLGQKVKKGDNLFQRLIS
ncbi:MAG: class I tRNA ligase family protein, partial [Candidatus Parcubacteria bacterium]|nr:class I tRNA ligase family protein [Candidatus Parcubacteria bacterium]